MVSIKLSSSEIIWDKLKYLAINKRRKSDKFVKQIETMQTNRIQNLAKHFMTASSRLQDYSGRTTGRNKKADKAYYTVL